MSPNPFQDLDFVALLVIFVATVYCICFVINLLATPFDEENNND